MLHLNHLSFIFQECPIEIKRKSLLPGSPGQDDRIKVSYKFKNETDKEKWFIHDLTTPFMNASFMQASAVVWVTEERLQTVN